MSIKVRLTRQNFKFSIGLRKPGFLGDKPFVHSKTKRRGGEDPTVQIQCVGGGGGGFWGLGVGGGFGGGWGWWVWVSNCYKQKRKKRKKTSGETANQRDKLRYGKGSCDRERPRRFPIKKSRPGVLRTEKIREAGKKGKF